MIFFGLPQIGLPNGNDTELKRALAKIRLAKAKTNHECPFCKDPKALVRHRWFRVFHNLVVSCEAARRLRTMRFNHTSQRLLLFA